MNRICGYTSVTFREFAELLAHRSSSKARDSRFAVRIRRRRLSWPAKIALRCYRIQHPISPSALSAARPVFAARHPAITLHQGSNTDGNAKRGERIAKHGLTQIAYRRVRSGLALFNASTPSLTRRPSESCAMRFANFSASGRSCVTIMMVIPREF